MKKLITRVGLVSVSLFASASAMAAVTPTIDVTAEANEFLSNFTDAAAVIGGVIVGAAFVAIVWKWIKGMIFS